MKLRARITAALTAAVLMITVLLTLTSCGRAGGVPASKWKGTWYRKYDQPFSRCYAEIKNVNSKGFDFSITVYNGNKAGELTDCHATFIKSSVSGDEKDEPLSNETDRSESAFYYAEDPRSYLEFFFTDKECTELNIIFGVDGGYEEVSPGDFVEGSAADYVEWTAFEGLSENTQITGVFSREESYMSDSLFEMGILEKKYDDALQKLMGDAVYFRLMCCFQNYTSERSDTTGANTPYEYDGAIHMHDGIGGTIYYGSMTNQQYAACVIAYDDGSVSAVISLENGSLSYYSDNWVYEKDQPYPILIWVENYTKEQNGEFNIGVEA